MESRFSCPTSGLKLGVFRVRRSFWFALVMASGIHLSILYVTPAREGEVAVKPLTTKFVKREPRLVKPLEMKKRPSPKPRPMRRKMVSVKAKISRRDFIATAPSLRVLDNLARPKAEMSRTVWFEPSRLEGYVASVDVFSDKEPEQKVDMSLEMLDIDALDTGKYHAMVIQNPRDKKRIKGYFHVSAVYARSMTKELNFLGGPAGRSAIYTDGVRAIPNIVNAINRYTNIRADIGKVYTFDSKELFKTPWTYISCHTMFKLTEIEADNLGKYLLSGGFLMADDDWACRGRTGDIALRGMFKDALAVAGYVHGKDWDFEKIPNDHPLYHCYFDFHDGPPMGNDLYSYQSGNNWWGPYDYIEGITIDDRLVGIMSNKDYVEVWGRFGAWSGSPPGDYTRQEHLLINIIVFALTQEDSITRQVMDYVE